jgi:hypothetical protein
VNQPKVIVVQEGGAAKSRYSLIFPNLEYHEGGLETFLRKELT